MRDNLITEYNEQVNKKAQDLSSTTNLAKDKDKDDILGGTDALIITFSEGPEEVPEVDEDLSLLSPGVVDISEFFELDEDELMDPGDLEAMPFRLPGAVDYVEDDLEEEEEEEEVEEVQTDWENDRDPKHFMPYVLKMYPGGIPKHDGTSTLGCERAVLFLTQLNKEISEALRTDTEGVLDLDTLEKIRVNMVKDIVTLKEHIKVLNKKRKKTNKKKSDLEPELIKEATTPRVQLVMTPFERAVAGIILNSVVSAGKPLEDVYAFLKKKYQLTPREELSIIQLLMDMGQPLFKDRGMIGAMEDDNDQNGQGLDFIKNYFA